MKNLLAPISTICVCSIFIGCSQESLIFYPEILPPDYKYAFSVPFEEVSVPVEAATLNALLFKAQISKGVVLYLHGNAESLRSWGTVAGDFTSRGYDRIGEVACPVYLFHGAKDDIIPFDHSVRLERLIRSPHRPSLLCCFGSGRGADKRLTSAESWVS